MVLSARKEVQEMDQIKIGAFLRELRKDRNLTQEAIAGKFGVTQRSVSRWENGTTMPDISVLIELADFYDVDLREILNGQRRTGNMNEDLKETLVMVSDYTNEEKKKIGKELGVMTWVCALFFLVMGIINIFRLNMASEYAYTTAMCCSVLGINEMTKAEWTWFLVKRNKTAYFMIAPFMILFFIFTIIPVFLSLVLSLTSFNMLQWPKFIFLDPASRLCFR